MSTPFPPPPSAPAAPKRRIWPWALGGCLVLLLLAGGALVAIGWFGVKALGSATKDVLASVPAVSENFGALQDAGIDWGATSAAGAAGKHVMVLTLTGEKGKGVLEIQLDPATQAFRGATLTLPDGQVRELDTEALERLKALSEGRLPPPPAN